MVSRNSSDRSDEAWGQGRSGKGPIGGRFGVPHPDWLAKFRGSHTPPDPTLRPTPESHRTRIEAIGELVKGHPKALRPWYNTEAQVVDQIVQEVEIQNRLEVELRQDLDEDDEGGALCLAT